MITRPALVGSTLKTVLIVDDEPSVLQFLAMILKMDDKVPVQATNGEEALEILRSGARIDAMITDITMPKMTGLELGREARSLFPDMPILLISGFSHHSIEDTLDLSRQGRMSFLHKPFSPGELMKALANILA